MYYCKKTLELSSSHCLELNYQSKCENAHGHNWIIDVYCKRNKLNHNGMVVDFGKVKDIVMKFDHKYLNDLFPFNPTAENLAYYFWDIIPYCYKVVIQESKNNIAWYEGEKKESISDD
jgi:6-pyruvoyltetrahydropterin/6-carboxytetrahydropterin synthase